MAEISYQEVVQTLRRHIGAHLEGTESDGRDEMERVLQQQLEFSHAQARDAINAMIDAGTLRYKRETVANDDTAGVPIVSIGTGGTNTGVGGGSALMPGGGLALGAGYWQIGRDDEDSPGLAGQISPS